MRVEAGPGARAASTLESNQAAPNETPGCRFTDKQRNTPAHTCTSAPPLTLTSSYRPMCSFTVMMSAMICGAMRRPWKVGATQ